jgi:L-threonylcarbamoyladenylate synthase
MKSDPRRFIWGPDGLTEAQEAALKRILEEGGLVAYPTDTLYGLGAHPKLPSALRKVYAAKGRAKEKPVSIILSGLEALPCFVESAPRTLALVSEAFWPGPVTVVLKAAESVSPEILGPGGTVAVRWPSSKPACALARLCGGGITATSANRAGEPAPVDPEEVCRTLGPLLDAVVDGGMLPASLASTILDLAGAVPRILREGAVSGRELAKLLPGLEVEPE